MIINKERELLEFRVGISECDSYKIMHNSMYFAYFEEGIICRLIGENLVAFDRDKPFKVLESRCRYIHSAKYNDKLKLITQVQRCDKNQELIRINQKLIDSNNTVISICKSLIKIDSERIIL
ncbi:MAG: acyl-CoA thioesterase [Clostridium sp.]|uniref:acyl-CoA thioesterase n=1 Tax=Clostridium sp. DSM 8431 TaxID=1761781 RepID=UPI0008E6E7AF|nr:acyl-CoA thioesterase [Clostridium sp. DSM 8431]MCR4944913.1 acyl-CoA thioesterase [Clostridium sp.]SFU34464.1 Acyl-CoA thioesterase FadM [Clostridium sp. DSM 8431]